MAPSADRSSFSGEEMGSYRNLARQYAKKSLLPLFEGEHSDGDLALLPEKLDTAFTIGIAASPESSQPGSHYGIWGGATDEQGMTPSLLLLSIVAETCGGVAMCLNAQGVATNLALQGSGALPYNPVRVGLCLQEGFLPPGIGTIIAPHADDPARIMTTAVKNGNRYVLSGAKSFVYSMSAVDAYVVFAREEREWACFLVPAGDSRVAVTDAGARTGLRACRVEHVAFNDVEVPPEARIDRGGARGLVVRALCLNWAGMAAIAVGIARGAVAAARKYAAERYQGGALIEEHPAVRTLMAGALSVATAAGTIAFSIDDREFASYDILKKSAEAKLAVMELCARAVTDCLQCFGGYGYMEDFGMEKRLRDITVLKSASGSPLYLRRMIFDIEQEKAR